MNYEDMNENKTGNGGIDAAAFTDYDQMKEKLTMEVVSADRNAEIFLLMHLPHVGGAFSIILSELFIAASGSLILQRLQPDSVGYCMFITICYLAASIFFLISNLRCGRQYAGDRSGTITISVRIFVAVLYIFAGIVMLAVPVKYLWMSLL